MQLCISAVFDVKVYKIQHMGDSILYLTQILIITNLINLNVNVPTMKNSNICFFALLELAKDLKWFLLTFVIDCTCKFKTAPTILRMLFLSKLSPLSLMR